MTYVIHHFSIERQVEIIRELLKVCGKIVIGDVMTLTRAEMDWAKEKDEQFWDNSETYLVVEEIQDIFFDKVITFEKKSYISGVITINN